MVNRGCVACSPNLNYSLSSCLFAGKRVQNVFGRFVGSSKSQLSQEQLEMLENLFKKAGYEIFVSFCLFSVLFFHC